MATDSSHSSGVTRDFSHNAPQNTKAAAFGSGALLLAASGLLVKVLGMVYKIPLTNLLGDGGMGYFNTAYTVYTLFFVVATSGMPVALSLLVAEALAVGDEARVGRLYRNASGLFLGVGIVASLLMALPARGFALLLGNEKAAAGILAVSPTLAFMTYASALRGYFQGRQRMAPIALSQVIEAAGKLIFGLALAYLAVAHDTASGVAAYALLGLTLASFLATLSLFIAKKRFDKREGYLAAHASRSSYEQKRTDRQRILSVAFPVTVGTFATTLASSLDVVTVMRRLESLGYSAEEANSAWGNYSALAVPLFNMPTVLILPIAYVVLPFVKGHLAKGEGHLAQAAASRALQLASCLSIPAALGLSLLAKPILSLLYTDPASVEQAAPLLGALALAVFPLALLSVTGSLLQAYGKLWFPIFSVGVGILVKLLFTYFGMPIFGMIATPMGSFLCYAVTAALNLACLAGVSHGMDLKKVLGKPFLAAIPTALVASVSHSLGEGQLGKLASLMAILLAVAVFILMLSLLRCFSEEDARAVGVPETWIVKLKKIRMLA